MSSLLERLTAADRDRRERHEADFREAVQGVAYGTDQTSPTDMLAFLDEIRVDVATFDAAVAKVKKRIALRQTLDERDAAEARIDAATSEIRAIERELEEVTRRLQAKAAPYHQSLDADRRFLQSTVSAERELRASYVGPLTARQAEISRALDQTAAEIRSENESMKIAMRNVEIHTHNARPDILGHVGESERKRAVDLIENAKARVEAYQRRIADLRATEAKLIAEAAEVAAGMLVP